MRKYSDDNQKNLETLVCNCCGKSLKLCNGMATEGVCHIDITWGYFSDMDGENHSLDLCEECYIKWINNFKVPVSVKERTELL